MSAKPRTAVSPYECPAPSERSLNKPSSGTWFSAPTAQARVCQSVEAWAIRVNPTPPTGAARCGKQRASTGSRVSR